jgi:AraC-like DNA-binding protein
MRRRGSISVILVRPLAALLQGNAAQLQRFLEATDLTPQLLANDDVRVTPAQFCVAWSEAARQLGDPQLALRLAAATPAGAFGVVEYVCRSAPTLGDALRHWVRYLNLLDDAVEVALVEEHDRACVRVVTESEAPAPASHELCFALLLAHARRLATVPFRALSVDFVHPAHGDVAAYRKALDAPVRFKAEYTQLVLPRSALALPLASADPTLLGILQRHADALKPADQGQPPLIEAVERALAATLKDDEATIETVGKELGLTARSLQRRLRDEGTTFGDLRDGVRQKLAARYLADGMSNAEISFLLGFSEPSAFFRAFKRWTGRTPEETRGARATA